jgi:hypothetical protein
VKQVLWAALLVTIVTAPVSAQDASPGFRSPSGNIHCQFFADSDRDADASMRCDLMQLSNRPPPRPRDCDLEYGDAFEITGDAVTGTRLCHGDTVRDDTLPALAYGQSWQRQGLTCQSRESGVSCINATGHGFELGRARQRVF